MKKWVRSHLRDQISPAILDSAPKQVAQVLAEVGPGGGHLFRKVGMAKVVHVVEKVPLVGPRLRTSIFS